MPEMREPEMRDIYASSGEPTGRTVAMNERLQPGEYFLHTILLLRDAQGRYLLQKRSMAKKYFPGQWDFTGGGVRSGETGREGAVREAQEELGLALDPASLVFGGRLEHQGFCFVEMWGVTAAFSERQLILQREEVDAVRLVDYPAFRQTIVGNGNNGDDMIALMDATHALLERA